MYTRGHDRAEGYGRAVELLRTTTYPLALIAQQVGTSETSLKRWYSQALGEGRLDEEYRRLGRGVVRWQHDGVVALLESTTLDRGAIGDLVGLSRESVTHAEDCATRTGALDAKYARLPGGAVRWQHDEALHYLNATSLNLSAIGKKVGLDESSIGRLQDYAVENALLSPLLRRLRRGILQWQYDGAAKLLRDTTYDLVRIGSGIKITAASVKAVQEDFIREGNLDPRHRRIEGGIVQWQKDEALRLLGETDLPLYQIARDTKLGKNTVLDMQNRAISGRTLDASRKRPLGMKQARTLRQPYKRKPGERKGPNRGYAQEDLEYLHAVFGKVPLDIMAVLTDRSQTGIAYKMYHLSEEDPVKWDRKTATKYRNQASMPYHRRRVLEYLREHALATTEDLRVANLGWDLSVAYGNKIGDARKDAGINRKALLAEPAKGAVAAYLREHPGARVMDLEAAGLGPSFRHGYGSEFFAAVKDADIVPGNYVPVREAKQMLGVTRAMVSLLAKTGKLHGVKIGRRLYVSREEVEARKQRTGRAESKHPSRNRHGRGGLLAEEIAAIERAHTTYSGNLVEAAGELSRDASTVRKYWMQAGLEIKRPGRQKKSERQSGETVGGLENSDDA